MTNLNLIIDFYEISKELEKQIDQIKFISNTICTEVIEAVPYRLDLIEAVSDLTAENDNCISNIEQIRNDLKTVGLANDFE
jgi:hypothetical protein